MTTRFVEDFDALFSGKSALILAELDRRYIRGDIPLHPRFIDHLKDAVKAPSEVDFSDENGMFRFEDGSVLNPSEYTLQDFYGILKGAFLGSVQYWQNRFLETLKDSGIADVAKISNAKVCIGVYEKIKAREEVVVPLSLIDPGFYERLSDELLNVMLNEFNTTSKFTTERYEEWQNVADVYNEIIRLGSKE